MRALVLFAALLVASCGPVRTMHPTVYIDEAFTPVERADVERGLDLWEDAVPELHFLRGRMDHATIIGVSLAHEPDTITIVRVVGQYDHDCPDYERQIGMRYDGLRPVAVTSHEVICVDAPYLESVGAGLGGRGAGLWFVTAIGHELGHAMGLPHRPPPSIMCADLNDDATAPTAEDVAALRELY